MEKNTSASNNDLPIKLSIKRKGFEISVEGTLSTVTSAADKLAELVDVVAEKIGEDQSTSEAEEVPSGLPTAEEISTTPSSDLPVIKPAKTLSETVTLLFDTPWGRTPHSVAEVVKALEINAVYDRVESISTNLIRLVRKGTLRRIPKDGKWAYVRAAGT